MYAVSMSEHVNVFTTSGEFAAHLTDLDAPWAVATDADGRPWIVRRNVETTLTAWSWVGESDYGRVGYDAGREVSRLAFPLTLVATTRS